MMKHKHFAACLFALVVAMADAPADSALPYYAQGTEPDGITMPQIADSDGHAVAAWFNTHPGCPDKTIVVEFTVDANGKVDGEIKQLSSTEIPTLDRAFLYDVQDLTFKPATKDGVAVASRFRYGLGIHRLSVCSGPRGGLGASTMP